MACAESWVGWCCLRHQLSQKHIPRGCQGTWKPLRHSPVRIVQIFPGLKMPHLIKWPVPPPESFRKFFLKWGLNLHPRNFCFLSKCSEGDDSSSWNFVRASMPLRASSDSLLPDHVCHIFCTSVLEHRTVTHTITLLPNRNHIQ